MRIKTPNPKFDFLYSKEARQYNHIVYYSGRGSGKSYSVVDYILWESFHKPVFTMVIRTSKVAVSASVWRLFERRISEHGLWDYFKKVADKIYGANGSLIQLFGSDDRPEDFKSIPDIDFVVWEESNKIKKEAWTVILPTTYRGGGVYKKTRNLILFNPEYAHDPVYEKFIMPIVEPWDPINERQRVMPQNTIIFETHWTENSLRVPNEMEQAYAVDYANDPEEAAWIWDGQLRTRSSGIVFKEGKHWSILTKEEADNMDQFVINNQCDCYIGLDFGSNSPTALVVMYASKDNKYFYISDERYQRDIDGPEAIYNMIMEVPEVQRGNQIIADSGALGDLIIKELKRRGVNIKGCTKSSGMVGTRHSIYPGVMWWRGKHQLMHPTRVKHCIDENRKYMFKKKIDGTFASDQFEDNDFDHTQDAKRYGVEALIRMPHKGSKPQVQAYEFDDYHPGLL